MEYQSGYVLTLANSIIGVGILAMPYCFKQCGVILSIILLLISSIISRLACHFLLKSAIIARRKTFEFLAFYIFGSLGKLAIEIGIIGFLLGTCVAFFVVMGDLGPEIVSEMANAKVSGTMRNGILIALAVFCVLPLGLLKNVDSLNSVSKATIGFYCCLALRIIVESLPHIFSSDWYKDVILWRPAGLLQCLPIFSMALFCQTQLFEIYQALPNASLEKMNGLVRLAVNICTWVYISVGAFGYIAFYQKPFSGNILLSFQQSIVSDAMKIGFVLSLAFSFPLVIFPCRASLYSLLYKGPAYTSLHEGTSTYIPEGKFKMLTVVIVTVSLIFGIMIPNIELVLGLIGSTIGVMICVLFPVTCFICISPKNTNERILAQIMLFIGIIVMVLGTYANLYAFEEANMKFATERINIKQDLLNNNKNQDSLKDVVQEVFINPKVEANLMDIPATKRPKAPELSPDDKVIGLKPPDVVNSNKEEEESKLKEVRHEPPQPIEPVESPVEQPPKVSIDPIIINNEDKKNPDTQDDQNLGEKNKKPDDDKEVKREQKSDDSLKNLLDQIASDVKKDTLDNLVVQEDRQEPVVEPVFPQEDSKLSEKLDNIIDVAQKVAKEQQLGESVQQNEVIKAPPKKSVDETKKNDEVDIEAIKREDTELKEQEKEKADDVQEQQKILIDTLQKQNQVNQALVDEQKKLIEVIQKQQEEKAKAVKEIENFAKKAIETISGQQETKPVNSDMNKTGLPEIALDSKKSKANPKPLSYQLGLDQENKLDVKEKDVEKPVQDSKVPLVPLPLAYAQQNQKNASSIAQVDKTESKEPKKEVDIKPETQNENKIVETRVQDKETVDLAKSNNEKVKNEDNSNDDDVKAMRRDILSDNDIQQRLKRDTSNESPDTLQIRESVDKSLIKSLNQKSSSRKMSEKLSPEPDSSFTAKVCQDLSRQATSTEKPIIKMLCKLSDYDVVNVDLTGLDTPHKVVEIQPEKEI